MMDSGVSDIPNNGITNAGLETSPETARKIFPPRTSSTLTQVDLDILSAQANVKTGEQANTNTNPNPGEGDPISQAVANFFSRPLTARRTSSWNPFRKQSGILKVFHAQSKRNRMVSKHGKINTTVRSDKIDLSRYVKDFLTSLIELSWIWTIFWFSASFFLSWLFFAVIWYLIAMVHGDLQSEPGPDHVVCVDNVKDFTEAFLFSLETQHTIGYGGRATTGRCSFAIITMCVQSITGVIISAMMAGIFFAKFTKPTSRGATIVFSRQALISIRDGVLYLQIRVGDLRQNHLIGCSIHAHFLSKRKTSEGEVIPYHLAAMEFGGQLDGSCNLIQPFWPLVVTHRIDSSSPLYKFAPRDINPNAQFEIIVSLEGTTPETGATIQTRTSYSPTDIIWGHRFDHTCVAYDKLASKYVISYDMINSIVQDQTPRLSAEALDEKRKSD